MWNTAYFNSQPRESGWLRIVTTKIGNEIFQLTAARRRLAFPELLGRLFLLFQLTAARRRLAAGRWGAKSTKYISTHSRAKAAGISFDKIKDEFDISTHSRAKAAGRIV